MTATDAGPGGEVPEDVWDLARARAAGLIEVGRRPGPLTYLRDIADRRDYVAAAPMAELRSRNANTLLGNVWHLLNPLLLAGVYYLIFGVILDGRDDPGNFGNYVAFLISGLLVFDFTRKCMTAGARSVVKDAKLLRSIRFPSALLPLAAVLGELLTFGPVLVVLVVVMVATGVTPILGWLWLVPVFVLQTAANLGLAFITARVTVYIRDAEQFLPYLLRIWLYLSGVVFSIERMENKLPSLTAAFELNPAYAYINLVRVAFFEGRLDRTSAAIGLVWAVVLLVGGYLFFWQREDRYSREV